MFEQLVRPFASRQVTTTRRIVPIRKEDETPEEAIIEWGSPGQLPRGVAQPKGVNLENIESVGFNLRGSIDKFHQSSRESDQVDVPIRDSGGAQIGTVTLDRAQMITYNKKNGEREAPFDDSYKAYYNQNYRTTDTGGKYEPYMPNITGTKEVVSVDEDKNPGLRKSVPSNNVSQRIDTFTYPK